MMTLTSGTIYLPGRTDLTRLPDGPDGIHIVGSLHLFGCTALRALPEGLRVDSMLDLSGCTALERLPDRLSVGRTLNLAGCTALRELPAGLRVGGWLDIRSCTALERLPADLSVGGRVDADDGIVDACGRVFRTIDGMCCVVVGERIVGGVTVLSVRHPRYRDGELVGEQRYVAIDGEIAAHGETIAEALEDLAVKRAGAGDLSAYRGMPLDTRKTPAEWAAIYRAITGACRLGVRDFIARQGPLAETYALSEILALTAGSYGADRFAAVVGRALRAC